MCYSGLALVSLRDLAERRRWHALQANMAAVAETANYAHAPNFEVGEAAGGGSVKQYCLCSPTQHPGSFRCRQHQAEYAWGGRTLRIRSSN
ncbi:hypothetical protein TorRG33x02_095820 [Trema orientale]|uniref:Uncharacterized protein n=1 Tax=Trema orientale TaxID=63057 RepID=A0A2P5F9S9_TREOI|nr:hypothetical protein TorRG33x02_095820 [Trema orientale]